MSLSESITEINDRFLVIEGWIVDKVLNRVVSIREAQKFMVTKNIEVLNSIKDLKIFTKIDILHTCLFYINSKEFFKFVNVKPVHFATVKGRTVSKNSRVYKRCDKKKVQNEFSLTCHEVILGGPKKCYLYHKVQQHVSESEYNMGKIIKFRESKDTSALAKFLRGQDIVFSASDYSINKASYDGDVWTDILTEFNSIAGTSYKHAYPLRTRFNDLTKVYNTDLESSINCDDHVLSKKLVNKTDPINKVEKMVEVSSEIYLKLLYKYKPYAMRKNRLKSTWILLIDEYNRKVNTNYHSLYPFQINLKTIVKEYNTNGYSVKCQDQELLEKVMRDYNKFGSFHHLESVPYGEETSVNSVEITAAAYEEDNSTQDSDGFSSSSEYDDEDILAVPPTMLH